ncbi:MAG: NAD(P)-dependent oxidoreductase [Nitrospinota bacterium]
MGERLGFVGLGKMGTPLTRNMLKDGHEVAGYDIDPERMRQLQEAGGAPCESAREVAERSDITFTMLLKPEHIEENTTGPQGVAAAGKRGLIHVEMSTMYPTWSAGLAGKLAGRGVEMLDAPVSGSVDQVHLRTLAFMVGGKREVFERVRPVIEPLARKTVYTGASGTGATMKLATNLFVNAGVALLSESMLLAQRSGVPDGIIMEVLRGGTVGGNLLELAGPRILRRDFAPQGAVEIFVKDMGMAIDLARERGFELQVVKAAREMFIRAEKAGWKKDDAVRVVEVYEGKAG